MVFHYLIFSFEDQIKKKTGKMLKEKSNLFIPCTYIYIYSNSTSQLKYWIMALQVAKHTIIRKHLHSMTSKCLTMFMPRLLLTL